MKKLITAALLLTLSQVSFANEFLDVECKSLDLNHINKLELSGSFFVSSTGSSAGLFDMSTTDAGNNQRTVTHNDVLLVGEAKYFPNQELKPFWEISLIDQESENIVQASLLVNYPGPLSSFVRFANGKVYKGNCTVK